MTRAEGCACAERSEPRPEPEAVAQGAPGCQRWRDHSEFFDRLLRRSLSSFFCTSALRLPADSQAGSALPTEERLYTFTELRFIAGARRPPSALRGFGMVDLWMVRERAGSEPLLRLQPHNKSARPTSQSRARVVLAMFCLRTATLPSRRSLGRVRCWPSRRPTPKRRHVAGLALCASRQAEEPPLAR